MDAWKVIAERRRRKQEGKTAKNSPTGLLKCEFPAGSCVLRIDHLRILQVCREEDARNVELMEDGPYLPSSHVGPALQTIGSLVPWARWLVIRFPFCVRAMVDCMR